MVLQGPLGVIPHCKVKSKLWALLEMTPKTKWWKLLYNLVIVICKTANNSVPGIQCSDTTATTRVSTLHSVLRPPPTSYHSFGKLSSVSQLSGYAVIGRLLFPRLSFFFFFKIEVIWSPIASTIVFRLDTKSLVIVNPYHAPVQSRPDTSPSGHF